MSKSSMPRTLVESLCVFTLVLLAPIALAQDAKQKPLVLAKQGSFFVNQENLSTAFPTGTGTPPAGHVSVKGMYVQYQIPQAVDHNFYPFILVHGAAHTGKTYEETPDGRMGWAEYFVRRGIPVYVVDHSGRARSGFDPTPTNRAKLENNAALVPSFLKFTNEQAWTTFRFGPKAFVPYGNTQFPVKAQDEYFAQMVPNTETTYPGAGRNTTEALAKLLDRIGPAVVFVHSQSGSYGIGAAIARPNLVKAVVSVEPRSCAASAGDVQAVFTHVPLLTMFGDFQGGNEDWGARMAECVGTVNHIKDAHGTAENIYLPDKGIHGNSHMLMMDLNNQQLADMILTWLKKNARR